MSRPSAAQMPCWPRSTGYRSIRVVFVRRCYVLEAVLGAPIFGCLRLSPDGIVRSNQVWSGSSGADLLSPEVGCVEGRRL